MSDRDLTEAIQKLTGTHKDDRVQLVVATVDSVNIKSRTCNVTTVSGKGSTAIENVKLMATVDDGVLIVPAIGSTIFISYSTYNVPYVTLFSEVDKMLFISGSSSLLITDGKIAINDGSYGGLVEVGKLVTKLNNLESLVNDMAGKFNSHTHILALSSGTGTAAPTLAPETTVITKTMRSELENVSVVHGK